MASFFRNTFDNLLNNISSSLNPSTNSPSRIPSNLNQTSRPPQQHTPSNSACRNNANSHQQPPTTDQRGSNQRGFFRCPGRPSNQPSTDASSRNQAQNERHHYHHHQPQQATFSNNMSNSGNASSYTTNASGNTINPNQCTANNNVKEDLKDIQEIRDLSDIDQLNARQLKYILLKNCVDYKGIIEKEELRAKVRQLWIDYHERKAMRQVRRQNKKCKLDTGTSDQGQRSQDSSDDIDENLLCKICMEREIDCVLLECGHYFTCVTCGRKLTECPICRQNVSRCVRTFRG